jgi:hypothetical protein
MKILANMKYFGEKHVNTLDVERMHQRCIKGFTSSGLAMDMHLISFECQWKLLTKLRHPCINVAQLSGGGKRLF